MEALVEISQLVKRYGDFTAVDSLTLSIPQGCIFALLGPNGAGKTTTIKLLMGMLQPTSGTLRVDGLDAFADGVAVKARVGYLPDEPAFYDFMRGSEIIRFAGEMHGLPKRVIQERGSQLAERLHLTDALGEFAENYSRGMKKKLGLICAIARASAPGARRADKRARPPGNAGASRPDARVGHARPHGDLLDAPARPGGKAL